MPKRGSDRKWSWHYPPYFTEKTVIKATGEVIAYRERYGLHEVTVSFDEADQRAPDCVLIHNQLYEVALDALKEAREKTPADVLAGIETKQPTNEEATIVALHEWWQDIAQRRGILSRPAMAADFLKSSLLSEVVLAQPTAEASTNDPEARERDLVRKKVVMCDFAHMWHRWHMEVFGEHAAAYGGLRHETSLLKATQSRQKGKEIREQCLMQYLKGRDEISAGKIADGHYGSINACLSRDGLRKFPSKDALKKAVLRARRANKSAKSDE